MVAKNERDIHTEKGNIEINHKQARTFLKWIYNDSAIYLQRKYDKYIKQINYEKSLISKKKKV